MRYIVDHDFHIHSGGSKIVRPIILTVLLLLTVKVVLELCGVM